MIHGDGQTAMLVAVGVVAPGRFPPRVFGGLSREVSFGAWPPDGLSFAESQSLYESLLIHRLQ